MPQATLMLITLLLPGIALASDPVRMCYYSNWSQYRPGLGRFMPSDIDPFLCTHLVYSFAKLNPQYQLTFYEWNDNILYEQFNGLKKSNPELKTLLAVGGWNAGSKVFSDMVASPTLRATFVRTTVEFLRKWDFDGFDLDWEYPVLRGGAPGDKENFIILIKELNNAFEVDTSSKPMLLLTAAVAAGKSNIDAAYDIPEMATYLDFINLMSYDLHGAWEDTAGHNSPLYARSDETGNERTLNMDWAAKYWLEKGTPKSKLVVGLATYGRAFKLSSANSYIIGAPARGAGSAGPYTREAGFLAYYEVCDMLAAGAQKYWEPEQQVPYLVQGDQWVGYDDEESIRIKLEYIKQEGYAGAMIWNIDLDDFNQQCPLSTRRYPLMSLMKEVLNSPIVTKTTTRTTKTTTKAETWAKQTTTEATPIETGPKRVCYYSNLSQYRPGAGKHMPADIDPFLCTHLIYAFARLDTKSELSFSEWNDETLYEEFNDLKKVNPSLTTLLAVGGWNMGVQQFSNMSADAELRGKFASTAVTFVRKWGFDGLEISWEFPASRGGLPEDRENFVELLKDLRNAFTDESTPKQRLLLSAAISADQTIIDAAYDIPNIATYLDFATLMTYDFHGDWDKILGHNSPLYARSSETGSDRTHNINSAANYLLDRGFPKEKLLIGLPAYGRSFQLSDMEQYNIGAPSQGPGLRGLFTKEPGFLAYYEVCQFLSSGAQRFWDVEQNVPHIVYRDLWVGYDDPESFTIKLAFIRDGGFGGASVWNLGLDDFCTQCPQSSRPYPLTSLMAEVLGGQTPSTHETTPTTTMSDDSADESGAFSCTGRCDDFYSDPSDCSNAYQCSSGKLYRRPCPGGLVWDDNAGMCTYSSATPCEEVTLPTTTAIQTTKMANKTTLETTTTAKTTTKLTTATTTKSTSTTTRTTTTTTTTTTTDDISLGTDCSKLSNGIHADPLDCHAFFKCVWGQKFNFSCGSFLKFNPATMTCDWPQKVTCATVRSIKGYKG